jgi:hypothetical protein
VKAESYPVRFTGEGFVPVPAGNSLLETALVRMFLAAPGYNVKQPLDHAGGVT